MVSRDLGHGFVAVPMDAVTRNGMALPQLNTMVEPYTGYWNIIAPNGRAIDDENGRPYLYRTFEDVTEDAARIVGRGEYSTCGGAVNRV